MQTRGYTTARLHKISNTVYLLAGRDAARGGSTGANMGTYRRHLRDDAGLNTTSLLRSLARSSTGG